MHYSLCLVALAASAIASSHPSPSPQPHERLLTVELAPGETIQVTEAEKLAMLSRGVGLIDVTDWPLSSKTPPTPPNITYPDAMTQGAIVRDVIDELNYSNIQANLEVFCNFHNRYYESNSGNRSSEWLLAQVKQYSKSFPTVAYPSVFPHEYKQSSIIAKIPGKYLKTIVVGAHQDSINLVSKLNTKITRAPGAVDNGSGSMMLLEVLRALLNHEALADQQAPNSIEFHWYAAEEVGLLGSGSLFKSYANDKQDIVAMLNQDMTGYNTGYAIHDMAPKFGVVTDRTDASLTNFTRLVIEEYTDIDTVDTSCHYGCSDHESATRAGYPSVFIAEGEIGGSNDYPFTHSRADTIENVDFDQVLEHAKLVVGFVIELAFADLKEA